MKQTEINEVVKEAIKASKEEEFRMRSTTTEFVMKAATSITSAVVIGISVFLIGLGSDVKVIKNDMLNEQANAIASRQNVINRLSAVEGQLKEPRFTTNSYVEKEEPKDKYMFETRELTKVLDKKVDQIENDVSQTKQDIRIIRMAVDPAYDGYVGNARYE